MRTGLLLFPALLISLLPYAARSQEPHSLWFHSLGIRQGLSQSYNWYVWHDSEGFVWVSSLSGLNRFDGVGVKQYHAEKNDTTSLLDENVYSEFFEDQQHNLWFSTTQSIHCYIRKRDHFQRYPLLDPNGQGLRGDYKVQFLEQDTLLWVSTGSALYRINTRQPYLPAQKMADTDQFTCRMELDAGGAVRTVYAFGLVKGLEIFTVPPGNGTRVLQPTVIFPDDVIREAWPEAPDRIWLATDNSGLVCCNPGSPGNLRRWKEFSNSDIAFTPWRTRYLIVAVQGTGIFILDKAGGNIRQVDCHFIDQKEDAIQSFRSLYLDGDDNLWVTDEHSGLYFANLHKSKFFAIPKFTSPVVNDKYLYWAIKEDKTGNIWIGTEPGGVFLLNKNKELIRHFTHQPNDPHSLPSNWVRDILVDNNNTIYFSTSRGLACFDYGHPHFQTIAVENGFKNLHINHLHLTQSGRILALAEGGGIFEVERQNAGKRLVNLLPESAGEYQTIFEGTDNKLYCTHGTINIHVFELQNRRLVLLDSLPVEGLVNGFYEDAAHGLLYFATSNGLVRLDKSRPHQKPVYYTEEQGLHGKFIGELLEDPGHNLWMGTNKGLARFNWKQDSVRTFALADGVQSPDFHLMAALKSSARELWFGGSGGITVVPADGQIQDVETAPRTVITGIRINDSEPDALYCAQTGATNVTQIKYLVLPYSKNTISFEFVAIEYSDPSNNRLRYMLAGHDDHWVEIEPGKPGLARYPKLPYGDYTFWLQGANSDGKWSVQRKAMTITIEPPWYLTWWFKTLVALTVLGLAYWGYRYRVAQIRKEAEMLRKEAEFKQKEAEFRQKEAETKQQMAETETAILRLQMNPHFIFNSMNSINAYILKNDIDTASDYLGRFAQLMRMILNFAAKPFISIPDEINLLDQYLQTESMRFEKKFSYSFDVDESIDPDETIIPTMILQPFVENAIWHGLLNKKGEGKIKISFKRQDDHLICAVEDNGIGREAARQLKSGKIVQESKALSITEHRLKLLEEETHSHAGYEIIDLINAKGKALGTQIILHLPLL